MKKRKWIVKLLLAVVFTIVIFIIIGRKVTEESAIESTKVGNNEIIKITTESSYDNSLHIKDMETEAANLFEKKRNYEGIWEFPDDMEFADQETVEAIKTIYNEIKFNGKFNRGNLELYDYYKKKYEKLLKDNLEVTDGKGRDLDFRDFIREYYFIENAGGITAYLFDMDEDDTPELCISDTCGTYILKYIPDTDRYYCWWKTEHSGEKILGSRKIGYNFVTRLADMECFYQSDKDGEEEYNVSFQKLFSEKSSETRYVVSLPNYKDKSRTPQLYKSTREQSYFTEEEEGYYFRVTKEQYGELIKEYSDAEVLSVKERVNLLSFIND